MPLNLRQALISQLINIEPSVCIAQVLTAARINLKTSSDLCGFQVNGDAVGAPADNLECFAETQPPANLHCGGVQGGSRQVAYRRMLASQLTPDPRTHQADSARFAGTRG